MPALLVNLQSSNLEVKEGAVNTLAILIDSSPEHAALVCTEHVLSVLVTLLQVQVCLGGRVSGFGRLEQHSAQSVS
jgi:hypothetical protein